MNTTEARRYIANAKDLLSDKARKEDGYYQDRKYVRMAGHTAYVGVLLALDEVFGQKTKGRKSVEWYQSNLSKADRKILNQFNLAHDALHLSMGYDGYQDAEAAKLALANAERLIDWAERQTTSLAA